MKSEQLSYLAGLVDGEGTIAIGKRKPKTCVNFSYTGYVKIFNTDKRMIDWILKTVKRGSIHSATGKSRRKTLHWWNISDKEAEDFLFKIYPFLVIKKEQAKTYFRFRKTFQKHFPRGTPLKLVEERDSHFEKLKQLHNI